MTAKFCSHFSLFLYFIILLIFLLNISNIAPSDITTADINAKISPAPNFSMFDAINPPRMLAIPLLASHNPIRSVAYLIGASFDTIDNPIGDKHNSPTVLQKYVITSHHILAFATGFSAPPIECTASTINTKPVPNIIIPNPIFTGILKSPFFLLASLIHNLAIIGESIKTNTGFNDWNHATGTVIPITSLLVSFSANIVNELPACSNPVQKKITNVVNISIDASGVNERMKALVKAAMENLDVSIEANTIAVRCTLVTIAKVLYEVEKNFVNDIVVGDGEEVKKKSSITIYVVGKGDTLWELAKRYRTTMDDIIRLNELEDPDYLVPGQKLLIPGRAM